MSKKFKIEDHIFMKIVRRSNFEKKNKEHDLLRFRQKRTKNIKKNKK